MATEELRRSGTSAGLRQAGHSAPRNALRCIPVRQPEASPRTTRRTVEPTQARGQAPRAHAWGTLARRTWPVRGALLREAARPDEHGTSRQVSSAAKAPDCGAARQSSATEGGGGGAGASTHKEGLAGAQEAALPARGEACKAAGLGPSSCREKAPSHDPAVEALHSLAQVWPRRRGMPLGCALSHWWPA